VVFGLAAPAIDILVERAGVALLEIGDDEACVGTLRASLDAGDGLAIKIDHGAAHAQQRAGVGQVFQSRDRRLRAQFAIRWREIERHLEHRIAAKTGGVGAVLIARRHHQQPKADDVGERVRDLIRRARVHHAGGEPIGDAKALLRLAQNHNPAVRGQQTAIEFGDDCLA
jgi:hypothetical protein